MTNHPDPASVSLVSRVSDVFTVFRPIASSPWPLARLASRAPHRLSPDAALHVAS